MAAGTRPFYLLITLFAFSQILTHLWSKHHMHPSSGGGGIASYLFKRAEPADGLELECEDVWDHLDRCAFVQEFCGDYPAGLVNYLHFYFCDLNAQHALALILMAMWMVFLFALVGVAASDFFCPNLNTIAKKLHLSESMTGVTFLAFGNASPDIFSTFSAIGAGSGTLAIGEVVGASSFITSIVVGSMAVVKPFKVSRAPFFRDIIFFTGCILFTLYMVLNGKITFWQSIVLIVAYVSYVALVVFGNWKHKSVAEDRQPQAVEGVEGDLAKGLGQAEANGNCTAASMGVESVEEAGPPKRIQLPTHASRPKTPTIITTASSSHDEFLDSVNIGSSSIEAGTQMVTLSSPPASSTPVSSVSKQRPKSILTSFDPSYNPKSSTRRCPAIVIDSINQSPSLSSTSSPPSTPPTLNISTKMSLGMLSSHEKRNGYRVVRSRSSSDDVHLHPQHNRHHHHHLSFSSLSLENYDEDDPSRDPSYTQFQQALLHHSLILPDRSDPHNRPRSPIFQEPPSGRSFQDSIPVPVVSWRKRFTMVFHDWIIPVYFPTLLGWKDKSWILRILAVGSIPIVLLLTLTLPVVELSEESSGDDAQQATQVEGDRCLEESGNGNNSSSNNNTTRQSEDNCGYDGWCRVSTMIQMVIAPVFITAVVTSAAGGGHLAMFAALGCGVALSAAVYFFSTEEKPPRFYDALAFMGFLVSMTWIFVVANEVVGILQAFGMILGVSDAILGLTVFAMGNSLGDLVANITIAKMGFPRMAFSACFGGPLLNMLLGVGISGTYVTLATGTHIPLEISPTILVSLGGVLVTMVGTMVVVPRSGYMLTRWWGFFLLAVYVLCMVVNVVLEVKIERSQMP